MIVLKTAISLLLPIIILVLVGCVLVFIKACDESTLPAIIFLFLLLGGLFLMVFAMLLGCMKFLLVL